MLHPRPQKKAILNTRFTLHTQKTSSGPEHRFLQMAALHLALTGGAILYWGYDLFVLPLAPITIATVHLFVLGVLTMALFGTAYRLLPRWTEILLPWPKTIPWVLAWLILGVWSIFLGIGTNAHPWTLLAASAGVGFAFGLFLLQSGLMLIKTQARTPIIPLLRLSILALIGVFLLGATFLGEYAHGFLPYNRFAMVGTHLTWGLFGWVGLFIFVIRLGGLKNNLLDINTRLLNMSALGALISLIFIPIILFAFPNEPRWLWLVTLPGISAMLLLTLASRHPGMGTTNPYWRMGDILGICAGIVVLLWPVLPDDRLRFLFGLLFLPGWSLSLLFGAYECWRPARMGKLLPISHGMYTALLALAIVTQWEIPLQIGGAMMILSAALFARGHK